MKKLITSLFIFFTLFLTAVPVGAIDLGVGSAKNAAGKAGYDSATNETTFAKTIGTVVQAILSLVGIIFLSLMVYAGYLWMTAMGEEEEVKKAKTIIRQSIIGLIITVGAYSITAFVLPVILARTTGG
ncbi:MAG: hypothetical protein COX81_01015 [Candidatus Magasanikbacteria bacterium CG_4_10_14_0_2_um_filter_37_12]|uniref:Uncharacterized protein n=1 Tax=Candidatus Magasanikbacteria bacterium CG_4_10_14_0_2_um_filter_37_12 TaxID=1974637 RepID=A0A2M7V953_9BACT|nr:MAG: hypothetical protein COX81_01015 [Candidatus Magasanikbacteria bacterium CG_4_10_14_0_2_um_filter_37_12]